MQKKKFQNIRTLVMDIDNTIMATHSYYEQAVHDCGIAISKKYYADKKERENFANQLVDSVNTIYKNANLQPLLIEDTVIESLKILNKKTDKQILWLIHFTLKDFYFTSPPFYPDTISTLKEIINRGYRIVLHSHAQKKWTRIKIDLLEKELNCKIPYLATSITKKKDSTAWKKAFDLAGTDINNILVVGDNFQADIKSSIKAGCNNLILIRKSSHLQTEDINNLTNNVHLEIVDALGEVLELLPNTIV